MKKTALGLTALLLAAQTAVNPLLLQQSAIACGPFFDQTVFSLSLHPDLPLKFFVRGKLGILKPSYRMPYQIVGYRYLSGQPLNAAEQAAYLSYWTGSPEQGSDDDMQSSDQWLKDREKVGGKLDPALAYMSVYRTTDKGRVNYLNCPSEAFKTASATLAKLVTKYGANSPACKEWIKGQDAVFCHCHAPSYDYNTNKPGSEPAFPPKLSEDAQLELRQHRMYQMAAAYFYAEKFDDAIALFTGIADDKASPWQTIAHYMIARSLIRKASLAKTDGYDSETLGQALSVLKQLAANSEFGALKKSIDGLIGYVQLRLHPGLMSQTLGKELASPGNENESDLRRKLDDYSFVLAGPGAARDQDLQAKPKTEAEKDSSRIDDLSNWLAWFGNSSEPGLAANAEGFKAHHNLAWAISYAAALSASEAFSEAGSEEVEKFLARTAKNDPGFVSASYYRARLLIGGKHYKEAEAVVAAVLASGDIGPSAANDLSLLGLDRAATMDQFLSLSFRPPAALVDGADTSEGEGAIKDDEKKAAYAKLAPVLLDQSAEVINAKFPLSAFIAAMSNSSVPQSYVKQFAQAAFVRAVILKDYASAAKVTAQMKKSYPPAAKLISDFENASAADKEFAAVYLILKCPGMRPTVTGGTGRGTAFDKIDDYQDNWWDVTSLSTSGDKGGTTEEDPKKKILPAPFLSSADAGQAKEQMSKLKSLGETPNYLGKIVIDYARTHQGDARVPEALALVVKATHLGSQEQSKTTAVSTQAFQILHKNYAGNPWTKKTPYHY